jgi:hypothetical protein
MTDRKIYSDLVNLARERSREAVVSVLQLVEGEDEQIALLINVAIDTVNGAAQYLQDREGGPGREEAISLVLIGITQGLGIDVVKEAARLGRRRP